VTPGDKFIARFLAIDWMEVVLETCALRGWQVATLARKVSSDEQHLRRLARGDVSEPRFFRLAFALLAEHADAKSEDEDEVRRRKG
jgi:ribosome-binding protein aMBF1 (putative translation factor)